MNPNCLRSAAHPFTAARRVPAFLWLTVAIAVLLATGCANVPPQSPADLQTKDGHKRALVLLRVLTEIDGRTLPAFSAPYALGSIWLGLGDFSSGGKLRIAPLGFFSKETRLDGWTYLLPEPGVYYLAPHSPQNENSFAYDRSWKQMTPCWRMEIPRDATVVYGGTLFVPGWGIGQIFGGRRLQVFNMRRFEVRDESAAAEGLREAWLKNLGPLTIHLVQSQSPSEPLILETPPGR